ncbi:NADH-quinone oxidoreductase subunit F, partial [Desulfotomaculum sp. 1211_IL3151]
MLIKTHADLKQLRQKVRTALEQEKMRILVCAGTGCVANGSLKVYEALKRKVEEQGLLTSVELVEEVSHEGIAVNISGCHGFCQMGPLVRFEPSGLLYCKVKVDDVEEIVNTSIVNDGVVERLLYEDPKTGEKIKTQDENPFYKSQVRVTLRYCGRLDPDDIYDYIAHRGYRAISTVLQEKSPQDIINEVMESGLRGRGGGGFPTGRKWSFAASQPGPKKYIICNGDEGDPGAFMDRSVMEGNPHSVLEGMMLAGYAIGADEGYIYARAEYPLAIKRMRKAIADAEAHGLLGNNILGSGFNFKINIKEGAGAFVCGEETALIASIEGERGMPRPRPPFPAVKGLWGCPTIINNVETL